MMEFEGAELTIYTTDGDEVSIDIDAVQLVTICTALGIKFRSPFEYSVYDDKTLKRILAGEFNPFRVKEI